MGDKLERMADETPYFYVRDYEPGYWVVKNSDTEVVSDGIKSEVEAKGEVRILNNAYRAGRQSALRTLSAVLAKCEGAMESMVDEFSDISGGYSPVQEDMSGKSYPRRDVWDNLRAALADLREVRNG